MPFFFFSVDVGDYYSNLLPDEKSSYSYPKSLCDVFHRLDTSMICPVRLQDMNTRLARL